MARSICEGLFLAALVLGANCTRTKNDEIERPESPQVVKGSASSAVSARLAEVSLTPTTGGYLVCSPRALHACRARAVDSISTVDFLTTDIAPSRSCASQEKLATQHCAGVGRPYDADNLKCLASQGVLNSLFRDPNTVRRGDNEPSKLTLRCAEGQTSIDMIPSL